MLAVALWCALAAGDEAKDLAWATELFPVLSQYQRAKEPQALKSWMKSRRTLWVRQDGDCQPIELEPKGSRLEGRLEVCDDARPTTAPVILGTGLQVGDERYELATLSEERATFVQETYELGVLCFASSRSEQVCDNGKKKICDVCQQLRLSGGKYGWSQPSPPIVADFTKTCKDPCPWGHPPEVMQRLRTFVGARRWSFGKDMEKGVALYASQAACEREPKEAAALVLTGLFTGARSGYSCRGRPCDAAAPSCPDETRCLLPALLAPGKARCLFHEPAASGEYALPVRAVEGVRCLRGPGDRAAEHHHVDTAFAVDLRSQGGKQRPVLAARSGVVSAIESKCGTEAGPRCALGNWVVLSHEDSEASSYAYLGRVDVTVGSTVAAGQPLGVEGTGPHAGVHFAVHRRSEVPGSELGGGPSVDFELIVRPDEDPNSELTRYDAQAMRCGTPDARLMFNEAKPAQ